MFVFSSNSSLSKIFPFFKWGIYSLLGINMIFFFLQQTVIEGIESLAWIVLLMLFEWETSQIEKPYLSQFEKWGIHIGRFIAYVLIVYSAYEYTTDSYIADNGKLDMFNASTWLFIVVLLELEVYFPIHYKKIGWFFRNILKTVLYSALFIIAILWGMEGEIFDFYDAALWIICFFFIELNLFIFEEEYSSTTIGS